MRRELQLQLFHKFYEEPLDYTHLVYERGMMYGFFIQDKHPELLDGLCQATYPIHMSDVPEEIRDEYRQYLRDDLISGGYTSKELIDTDDFVDYTLECFSNEIECNEDMLFEYNRLEKVEETINELENVYNGLQKVLWNWHDLDMNNLVATKIYPFDLSLDEFLSGKFSDWIQATTAEFLGELDTVAEIVSEY